MSVIHESAFELFAENPSGAGDLYMAALIGLKDFAHKNGFHKVLLGLSGGIDSAFVAALATDAFGPEQVDCVMLPSPFTSRESMRDAAAVAGVLGVKYRIIPIEPAMDIMEELLAPHMAEGLHGTPHENLQARLRGLMLMTISNAEGSLLLATSNKSELAVGYATLYGDMCGGYAPIKDIYKTHLINLARWRNTAKPTIGHGPTGEVFSDALLTKAPSAELRENQKDEDSLPPYAQLDKLLYQYIENRKMPMDLIADGISNKLALHVWHLLARSEYKRHQAAPGTRLSQTAFGKDWRWPLANRFAK